MPEQARFRRTYEMLAETYILWLATVNSLYALFSLTRLAAGCPVTIMIGMPITAILWW